MAGKLSTVILALTIALHPTPVLAPISFCLPDKVQEQVPEPGAYDGLTKQEIKELEAEREAARLIDQQVSRGGQKVMVMEATAYTWTGNQTATGSWPTVGTVAVDPQVVPLGSVLYVEGYGPAVAADTGGDIKGQIIDLYMDSEHECLQWGRRKVEVVVE